MNAAVVRLVLERKTAAVDYVKGRGAACPVCGRKRCRTYRSMPVEGETRIRYHVCLRCSARFRSVEEVE